MKKKSKSIFVICICAIVAIWAAMFTTDYFRCSSLKEPLFVVSSGRGADDSGLGTYQGIGYTVDVEKYTDAEFGVCVRAVEMKVFGKVIAASIT